MSELWYIQIPIIRPKWCYIYKTIDTESCQNQKICQYWFRACFLSVAQSKLRLCLANHRVGYFSNLACDWLSIVWTCSEQQTENGPWLWLGAWRQTTTWLCPSWKGSMVPILCSLHHYCSMSEFYIDTIDLIHKSHDAPVSYPTMQYSEQKCAHVCFEWCIVGYGTGA